MFFSRFALILHDKFLMMEQTVLPIHKGRPHDCTGRQPREIRVYDLLDSLGISYERIDHDAAMTMEVCAQIDAAFGRMSLDEFRHCDSEERQSHAIVCKNLFLCNRQKTSYYMLMMPGQKKFLTKDLSKQIGSARLSFAGADEMRELLDLTPGSVSVLGLMNDRGGRVRLLIDSDVLRSQYVGCHPCMNTSSLRLRTSDLLQKILPAIGHEPTVVSL